MAVVEKVYFIVCLKQSTVLLMKRNKKVYSTKKYDLEQHAQAEIAKDINNILTDSPNEQIIVYIQDKTRLNDLINTIQEWKQKFELYLEELMKTAEITIHDTAKKAGDKKLSYLKLLDDIRQEFTKLIDSSSNTLLYFPAIQTGYVLGSLLIVSLANRKVDEVYRLKIDDKTITLAEILSELEQDTQLSENIQVLIGDILQLVRELEQQKYRNQKL